MAELQKLELAKQKKYRDEKPRQGKNHAKKVVVEAEEYEEFIAFKAQASESPRAFMATVFNDNIQATTFMVPRLIFDQ